MKHEITSLQTKKLFANALKSCMNEKPFSKVTVNDLISACGVNRNTFYYHFQDIYALLKWTLEQDTIEVIKQFDLMTNYEEAILFILNYVEKNNHLISCAFDAVGQMGLKQFFYKDCIAIISKLVSDMEQAIKVQVPENFKAFLSSFYTEALAGMLIEKVVGNQNYSDQEFVDYFDMIFKTSLPQALILADEKRRYEVR